MPSFSDQPWRPNRANWDEEDALLLKINQLKREIESERVDSVKDKLENNRDKLRNHTSQIELTTFKHVQFTENNKAGRMLFLKIQNPLIVYSGFSHESREEEIVNAQDVYCSMSTKLPKIENIPSYTTWIFLDKNQRMAANQSVVGRRRIYYDRYGSEALICSDSEEESPDPEEDKYEFCEGEDRIIWHAFEEHGPTEEVANFLTRFTGGTTIEIQERYATVKNKYVMRLDQINDSADITTEKNILQDRSLGAALDSFDNLFCRRCLVFDCHLHGCSQNLIFPSEKQSSSSDLEVDGKPCSDNCYLRLRADKDLLQDSARNTSSRIVISSTLEEKLRISLAANSEEGSEDCMGSPSDQVRVTVKEITPASKKADGRSEVNGEVSKVVLSTVANPCHEVTGKRKLLKHTNMILQDSDSLSKKPKLILSSNIVPVAGEVNTDMEHVARAKNQQLLCVNEQNINKRIQQTQKCSVSESCVDIGDKADEDSRDVKEIPKNNGPSCSAGQKLKDTKMWKPFEKDLYLKGVEMFGRNSCLIAKNLLSSLKTCIEVYSYMYDGGSTCSSLAPSSYLEEDEKPSAENVEKEMRAKSRLFRRRGRAKKLKYSWKTTSLPSVWKRIADGKIESRKQYTPCGCQSMCGKKCSCLHNGTCCEKYCGCSKSCKNRFRGCHCAKSQCRSRQCPCFAALRECDPDVCKNCWASCGDETLGEPPRQGDGQCGNMRLLLRQQQKILLGKSDVAGWGAFIKKSVNKDDYLGEYTGELISDREADKRGKIYDRANSSYLFDLNDQCVLDAYRKGDKLKFANHSSNPNCYARVMFVAGDHRVGIFAKERIEASDELFYDYQYNPNEAPVWARKPDSSKREESSSSHGRAKKHQSHY